MKGVESCAGRIQASWRKKNLLNTWDGVVGKLKAN